MTNMLRSYGWLITEEKWADCDSVVARVMAREDNAKHPVNPRTEGEDSIWGAPKNLDGYMLNGLEIRFWLSSTGTSIHHHVLFDKVRFVDERLATRLLKTMKKINRAIGSNIESGDMLMAVSRALNLTWYAEKRTNNHGWSYSDDDWRFHNIHPARDLIRASVNKFRDKLIKVDAA